MHLLVDTGGRLALSGLRVRCSLRERLTIPVTSSVSGDRRAPVARDVDWLVRSPLTSTALRMYVWACPAY